MAEKKQSRKGDKVAGSKSGGAKPASGAKLLRPAAVGPLSRIKVDPVEVLINGLMNHQMLTTVEGKGKTPSRVIPEAKILEARTIMRTFFSADKTYRFRMTASFGMQTNGSGVLLGFQSFSPANTSFNEWSALSALFDQVKGHTQRLTISSTINPTSTVNAVPFVIAADWQNTTTAPSSGVAVNRLAGSVIFNSWWSTKKPLTVTVRYPSEIVWANTGEPDGQNPPCGLTGQWSFANLSANGTVSFAYFLCWMDSLVVLRCRA